MAKLVWEGLAELKTALRSLPADLATEASNDVIEAGNVAAVRLRTAYGQHVVTGHLQDSVTVRTEAVGPYGAAVVVRVNDPIAWLFDNGSQARHYTTVRGKPHSTGAMWGRTPPMHVAARTFAEARREMYDRLKSMLERNGLSVSGEP